MLENLCIFLAVSNLIEINLSAIIIGKAHLRIIIGLLLSVPSNSKDNSTCSCEDKSHTSAAYENRLRFFVPVKLALSMSS